MVPFNALHLQYQMLPDQSKNIVLSAITCPMRQFLIDQYSAVRLLQTSNVEGLHPSRILILASIMAV